MKYAPIALAALATLVLTLPGPALASEKSAASHESRCTHEARDLKGEEREKFLADCHHPRSSQQEKMKTCNADAGKRDLHGDERRAFMSTCLKG